MAAPAGMTELQCRWVMVSAGRYWHPEHPASEMRRVIPVALTIDQYARGVVGGRRHAAALALNSMPTDRRSLDESPVRSAGMGCVVCNALVAGCRDAMVACKQP